MTEDEQKHSSASRAYVIAQIRFKTTEEGGRNGPTPPTHLACIMDIDGVLFDCRVSFRAIGSVAPGQAITAPIYFLSPEDATQQLHGHKTFLLRDFRVIAEGEVIEFKLGPPVRY